MVGGYLHPCCLPLRLKFEVRTPVAGAESAGVHWCRCRGCGDGSAPRGRRELATQHFQRNARARNQRLLLLLLLLLLLVVVPMPVPVPMLVLVLAVTAEPRTILRALSSGGRSTSIASASSSTTATSAFRYAAETTTAAGGVEAISTATCAGGALPQKKSPPQHGVVPIPIASPSWLESCPVRECASKPLASGLGIFFDDASVEAAGALGGKKPTKGTVGSQGRASSR